MRVFTDKNKKKRMSTSSFPFIYLNSEKLITYRSKQNKMTRGNLIPDVERLMSKIKGTG